MERVKGIEPSWPVWKTGALPLSYTRVIEDVNAPLGIVNSGGNLPETGDAIKSGNVTGKRFAGSALLIPKEWRENSGRLIILNSRLR